MEERVEPGVYRHYRGGLYRVLFTALHHESRRAMVVYVSMTHGSINVRPMRGTASDPDGFLDEVRGEGTFLGDGRARFTREAHVGSM